MEFVAWFTHKYVMQFSLVGPQRPPQKDLVSSKNDLFFLIFAVPSWLCIMLGMMNGFQAVGIGYGIALYE